MAERADTTVLRRSVRLVSKPGGVDVVDVATGAVIPRVASITVTYTSGEPIHQVSLKFADGKSEVVDCDLVVTGV